MVSGRGREEEEEQLRPPKDELALEQMTVRRSRVHMTSGGAWGRHRVQYSYIIAYSVQCTIPGINYQLSLSLNYSTDRCLDCLGVVSSSNPVDQGTIKSLHAAYSQ